MRIRPFTQQEYDLAMRLAKDARTAYKSHAISERELRDKFDHIRSIINHPPMSDKHFAKLLEGLR